MLRICAGPGAVPGATISSPVTSTAGPDRTRHPERRAAGRGGEDEVGRREAAARGEEERALLEDLPAEADVRAGARRDVEPHGLPVDLGRVLDGDDRVAAGRHRGAGHHLPGGARRKRARHAPRARGSRAREERGRLADLRGAHGPAVHRGRVERREGQVRRDVLGEDPPGGVGERDGDGRERRDGAHDAREGLVEREHGGDRSKALTARASVSRIRRCRNPRFNTRAISRRSRFRRFSGRSTIYRVPGVVTATSGDVVKKIYLMGGNVIFATSSDRARLARRVPEEERAHLVRRLRTSASRIDAPQRQAPRRAPRRDGRPHARTSFDRSSPSR